MSKRDYTRRKFINTVSAGSVAALVSSAVSDFSDIAPVNYRSGNQETFIGSLLYHRRSMSILTVPGEILVQANTTMVQKRIVVY